MKPINFIHTVPLVQQRAIMRWLFLSLLLLVVTIIGVGSLCAWQWYLIYEAKKVRDTYTEQKVMYDQLHRRLQELKDKQRLLSEKNRLLTQVNSGVSVFKQMPLLMRIFNENGCRLLQVIQNEEHAVIILVATTYEQLVSSLNAMPRDDYIKDIWIEQLRIDEATKYVQGTIYVLLVASEHALSSL